MNHIGKSVAEKYVVYVVKGKCDRTANNDGFFLLSTE